MEADFQAQAEGNQPQNISCFAFPPSALNALPREDQITVIRGNNSQSSVVFGDASALSKIIFLLRGEAHFSSKCDGAAGRRCRSRGERPGSRGGWRSEEPGTCTRSFVEKISRRNESDGTLVFEKAGRRKLRFKLNGEPNVKLILNPTFKLFQLLVSHQ